MDGRIVPACNQYYVPSHFSEVIDYSMPGINLGESSSRNALKHKADPGSQQAEPTSPLSETVSRNVRQQIAERADSTDVCTFAITPTCIQKMYNITMGTISFPGYQLGLFQSPNFTYSQMDLNDFFETLYPIIPQGIHPHEYSVDEAREAHGPAAQVTVPEANLDMQLSYPILWPQNIIMFEVGDPHYTFDPSVYNQYFPGLVDDFLYSIDGSYCSDSSFGVGIDNPDDPPYPDHHPGGFRQNQPQCGVFKAPNVFSTSYGGTELGIGVKFLRRQCLEWMKLGMQGTTVLTASGDTGCPYVTSVGGTGLPPGGFGNIFPRPAYQKQAVESYLDLYPPPFRSYSSLYNSSFGANDGVFNESGRAYPDVSAIAQAIAGWSNGNPIIVDDTSAAAPLFGAIMTRINEVRLQQGKPTVGFINPVLYAHPELFTDVTTAYNSNSGNSPPCNTTSPGFSAAPGWDPVTGLGTPKFQALMDFWSS